MHRAEPYFEFFTKETVRKLFSQNWHSKEEGYSALINELKTTSESGTHAVLQSEKLREKNELLCTAVERGLNDKIVQVRIKACDLLIQMLHEKANKPVDIKELSTIIGILVDFLSENNTKIKEKSEETLRILMLET